MYHIMQNNIYFYFANSLFISSLGYKKKKNINLQK